MPTLELKQQSWTETAEIVRAKLGRKYPNIENSLNISKGVLSKMPHDKPEYALGFVFAAIEMRTGNEQSFVYYPIDGEFFRLYSPTNCAPLTEESVTEWEENERKECTMPRGEMHIVKVNGEYGVSFNAMGYNTK